MSSVWQVQEAKNHFSEMIDRALSEGPQTVTRHGKPVVRMVAVEQESTASHGDDGFVDFLLNAPKADDFELPERTSIKPLEPLGE
ncbi:type II toxin-antitoxin system Phd/YefM family antitoxin [Comamonas sp. NLF-1-9]|uniref:type II toxin-antitoxin system Phd/YefM family antitoxin n=1 Tax=Comamonas sp. NLF-1-9 TaxID=2853163 RepID=UPI001C4660A8|nr:type II toxin-antitoxin system Phd/YefM family antitoxin [Comamonas sp. NLF-1-9]QXL85727.1 type II toxin-antitoxin system Phd/YefM family antitoxin [Comamonas sp. NLF-1-9]